MSPDRGHALRANSLNVQATDTDNEEMCDWHSVDMNHRVQCVQWLGAASIWFFLCCPAMAICMVRLLQALVHIYTEKMSIAEWCQNIRRLGQ